MEEIKQLLTISKKYRFLLERFQWKIDHYLNKNEPYDENDVSDIARQFSDIGEFYLNELLIERRRKITNEDISALFKITEFAREKATKEYQIFSQISHQVFHVLAKFNLSEDLNLFDPSSFVDDFERIANLIKKKKEASWTKLIRAISIGLKRCKEENVELSSFCLESFLNAISKKADIFSSIDLNEFIKAISFEGMQDNVSYLLIYEKINGKKEDVARIEQKGNSIEELHKSLKHLLNAFDFEKFEESKDLIFQNKNIIINTLTNKLIGDYENVPEPKKGIKSDDRFQEAKRLIYSLDEKGKERGLELFRDISRNRNVPQFSIKTWLGYAEYKVSPITACKNWENELENGKAGWETRWNLAIVYLRFKQPYKALQVLKNITNAPFHHLKFTLYIALEIYKAGRKSPELSEAISFLLEHLVKLPIAECYLVHLLLKLEEDREINLMEYDYLENYAKVSMKNIQLLDTKSDHEGDSIIRFQHDIMDLNLVDTWLIWIKDYAESHYFSPFAWKMLSEAYLKKNDKINAEKALKHNIDIVRYNPSNKISVKYLRSDLLELFDFYIKQALTDNAKSALKEYKGKFGELWDFKNPDNYRLIKLTKKFDPDDGMISKKMAEMPNGSTDFVWTNLNEPISKIASLNDLKNLSPRIIEAFKILSTDGAILDEKKEFFKELLQDFVSIDHHKNTESELQYQLSNINSKLKVLNEIIASNHVFHKLKPLRSAFSRVFEETSKSLQVHNKPIIGSEIIGDGLPNDVQTTSLLIDISNQSVGDIENLEISCNSANSIIRSTDKYRLHVLKENSEIIAALPVFLDLEQAKSIDSCTLELNFSWGILKNLSDSKNVKVKWFSFIDYIHQFERNKHEFIKLFVDDPINFSEHDNALFQGRDDELKLIRSRFIDSKDFQPIYFHGTRKVGKTSLLKKIEIEFKDAELRPLYIDLSPINPLKGGNNVISTIMEYLYREAKKNDLIDPSLNLATSNDPLITFEKFVEEIYTGNQNKRVLILLDEFQLICHSNTVELLDLFRRLSNNGLVAFVLCGLLRPEIIRIQSSGSQFSFYPFAVDFLKYNAVQKLLLEPVAHIGLKFHSGAINLIFKLTSGHPFHISKIVQFCIDILNHEHRNLVVEDDINKAAQIISKDDYVFSISSFSDLVITPDEKNKVTAIAKEIENNEIGIPLTKAKNIASADVLTNLQQKFVIEIASGNIKIKGMMLWMYLKNRMISSEIEINSEERTSKRIGIFIDYENIAIPNENSNISVQNFLKKLTNYYSQMGRIVCKWAAAFDFKYENKIEFQKAGFDIKEDSSIQKWKNRDRDTADFILLEIISEETSLTRPEIFVIVAGDIDYFEKIKLLNKQGYFVRLAGYKSRQHIKNRYFDYFEERKTVTLAEGDTIDQINFIIDDIDEIIDDPLKQ